MPAHKYTPEEQLSAFWNRVDKSAGDDGCWLWIGGHRPTGYGCAKWNGRMEATHRISFMLAYGTIPDGMYVCHHCDNPPCCNPKHLFLGTPKDNVDDQRRKGRMALKSGKHNGAYTHPETRARGERNGNSKLTKEQVVEIRQKYAGGIGRPQLALEYEVTFQMITSIVRREFWKHVP